MMTCEDCLHIDICKDRIAQYDEETANQIKWGQDGAERNCKCGQGFEDKSLYIKVPCRIGDTVYYLATECDGCKDRCDYCQACCKKSKEYTKVNLATIKQFRIYGNIHDHMTTTDNIASTTEKVFYFRDIGETVFLTKKEATDKMTKEKKAAKEDI